MMYRETTQVPNALFDIHLPSLTESELKILLVIIRQTNGWIDKTTGKRKTRDRISHSQFMRRAGVSRRVISKAITSLLNKGLITLTDFHDNTIHDAELRKGRSYIFYAHVLQPAHRKASTSADSALQLVHQSAYNKTNETKLNETKPRSGTCTSAKHISSLLQEKQRQQRMLRHS